jgi:PAS domain S-box-containing protein
MNGRDSKHRRIKPRTPASAATHVQRRVLPTTQRLKTILDAVTDGYWYWNLSSGEVSLGDGWMDSLGYSAKDFAKDTGFLAGIVHPEDRDAFDAQLASTLDGRSPSLDCECRLRTKTGPYKWFLIRGKVVRRDKRDRALHLAGLLIDRTARKEQQEQAELSYQQQLAIFHATKDSIWVVDPVKFELMAFNKTFEELILKARGIPVRVGMRSADINSERADSWNAFFTKVLEEGKLEKDYQLHSSNDVLHLTSQTLLRDGQVYAIAVFGHDITERKRMEEALRKSEERFATAFRRGPLAFMLTSTRDSHYIEVNDAFEEITGYRREEVIGKTPYDIGLWVKPEQRVALLEQAKATGYFRAIETPFRTRSGEIRQALGTGTLIEIDGEQCLLAVAVDITDRKRALEALRDSEELLRIAIESGPMYAFEWDPETDLVRRSERSAAILSLPANETQSTRKEFVEAIHPDDREQYLSLFQSLTPDKPAYKTVLRFTRSDHEMVWLEESGRAFFEPNGKISKVVGMTSDVTEARRAESVLRDLSGRLITSQEEERRRVARELHDHIGQELALLCVQAHRIDSGLSDEEHTLRPDVHELYRRIKDIATDVSRLSHRLHSSELDFLGLSAAAERLCRDFANQHGIDMDYQIRNVPSRLDSGKSLCFYRVLQEALQNVAKHSRATRVVVELLGKDNQLNLKVTDNGSGFEVDKVRFESGLGLVSIRERLNLVGGWHTIHSDIGQGTTLAASVSIAAPAK